jgi:DNA-directed RNA polymerase subunit E'/Rpb7
MNIITEMETQKSYKPKRREMKISSIYSRCLISRNITLPVTTIGKNIQQTIEQAVSAYFEGKCIVEGYVKPESIKIVTYSSGTISRGMDILFQVVFECNICFPVEGMLIACIAQNITKAGIKAQSADENPSPVVVFIARDHNFNSSAFSEINVGDKFNVRVIGQRFELNDKYVSIIGELVKPKKEINKPKLIINDD